MITSGRDVPHELDDEALLRRIGAFTSPSRKPERRVLGADDRAAARRASSTRIREISSREWTKLPMSPVVAWHMTTSCPSRDVAGERPAAEDLEVVGVGADGEDAHAAAP